MTVAAYLTRLFGPGTDPSTARCDRCAAFDNDPHAVEAAMPGLRSLGSATSSVRDADGLCRRQDRYIRASGCCAAFELVGPPP